MNSETPYPRDLVGHGATPPHPHWPNGARIAVQFVLNYEEGAESSVLHGDAVSETFLSDLIGAAAFTDRHLSMESMYEYGSRAGVWRVLREFERRGWPLTVFAVAMALERHPALADELVRRGHEIACHGWRWVLHQAMPEAEERAHIARATERLRQLTDGAWPLGWYTGRDSPNTKRLVADHGGYLYDSDHYGDDLPFWQPVQRSDGSVLQRLVVPYALDTNDMRFASPGGFPDGAAFERYLTDAFDVLYAEGTAGAPKLLNVGLHCRLVGRPGRFRALQRFMDHLARHDGVWVCRRIDIARHWVEHFPAPT